jgi:LPXTG-site transpeptidase (sortase) family protein
MRNSSNKILYTLLTLGGLLLFVGIFAEAKYGTITALFRRPSYEVPLVTAGPPVGTTPPAQAGLPTTDTTPTEDSVATQAGVGARLSIPSINVNAPIENVGIDAKGNMAVPGRLADVGWYKYGAPPGGAGVAVIAGHVDNALTRPAVFYDLHKVNIGDDIYIRTASGKQVHYVVKSIDVYLAADAPAVHIFHDTVDGKPTLRLITCLKISGTGLAAYDHRVVVTATLV